MTLKGVAKFKRKLTCGLNNDIRNLVNFYASSWKFALLCATFANSIKGFTLKSTEGLSLMALKKDLNFEEKLTFFLKTYMRYLVNFNLNSGKV